MWKKERAKRYSCLSTDQKQVTTTGGRPIEEESTLIEVHPDGSLKGYLFIQGAWRPVENVYGSNDVVLS